MLGTATDTGRVRLYASRTMKQAELTVYAELVEVGDFVSRRVPDRVWYELRGRLDDVLILDAPDWPAAFNALFKDWSPSGPARPQLSGTKGIEDGD